MINASSSPSDRNILLSDITTNNVTSTKHGFTPKSPANAAQFLNGAATPAFAAVTDANLSVSDITTNDASTSAHGFAPKTWASGWVSWTPTYTNLTVGNGTHQSYYIQIGKTIIGRVGFVFGTTSSMGTGPVFSLPVTSNSNYTNGEWMGGIRIVASATGYTGYIQWNNTTTANLTLMNVAGTYTQDANISSSAPASWGTGASFYGTFSYEAA